MRSLLGYITSVIFYLAFGFILVINHAMQVIAFRLFGYRAHKWVVDLLSGSILAAMRLMGARIRFKNEKDLPHDRPLIIVSNHQSMFDIPAIGWFFKDHHPKYIAKIELGKNIPSVSYNLRHGGSVLIDRSNQKQALTEIIKLGRYIEKNNFAASIFPEGTRSRTGKMKPFKPGGLQALVRTAPSALIVPFVIDGHSELQPKGLFPLRFGCRITYTMLDPIEGNNHITEQEIAQIHEQMAKVLNNSSG